MKSGWAIKKLGEVCEILYGFPFESKLFNSDGKGQQVVRIRDVLRGYSETYTTEKCESKYVLSRGDVLIGMDGDFHMASWKVNGALLNQRVCKIDSGSHITNKYLLYVLPVELKKIWDCKLFSTVKHLSAKDLNGIEVVLPPLPEQKRIVAKIDAAFEKIDKLKANAERNLANAKELFQSALDEAMRPKKGWVEKRLGDVATIRVGPFGSSLHKADYVPKGVPLINPCHMRESKIDSNITTCVSTAKANELKEYRVCEGDIVFARRGEIGRLAFVSEREEGYLCGTGSLFARFYEKFDSRFLYYAFSTKTFVSALEKLSTGTTMKSINSSALESMSFAVPPVQEQGQIVKRLDILAEKTELLEQHYTRQIADCAEMRQSVLREAFEGRL